MDEESKKDLFLETMDAQRDEELFSFVQSFATGPVKTPEVSLPKETKREKNLIPHSSSNEEERRYYPRHELKIPMDYVIIDESVPMTQSRAVAKKGVLVNLSQGGVLLETLDVERRNSVLELLFPVDQPSKKAARSLRGKILRVKRVEKEEVSSEDVVSVSFQPRSRYQMGIAFV